MLDDIVDVLGDLFLVGDCLSDGVGCCWVDFLRQVQQEVEVAVFETALFHVFVLSRVFLEVLLSGLVADYGRELAFFDDREFVVF